MILIELWAQAQASSSTERIFSRSWSGPDVTTRARLGPSAFKSGNQTAPSTSWPVVKNQSWGKGIHQLRDDGTPEPEMRVGDRMRRMGCATRLAAEMFMPPVKPTVPSTTSSFLWLRRLRKGMRQGRAECMKSAAGTPLRFSRRKIGGK